MPSTRMTMKVPLHFKGEEESDAVKLEHNLVNHVMTELEVNCLPADLPEFIEVDLSGLKKNGTVTLKDIKLPRGVKCVSHGKVNPVLASAAAAGRRGRRRSRPKAPKRAAAAPAGKGGKAAAKTPAAKTPLPRPPRSNPLPRCLQIRTARLVRAVFIWRADG